jgi:adenosylcobinamide kinase/adenosylcobinamide-phosphate guanylyltransferase
MGIEIAPKSVLITGGARSGKSTLAQDLATKSGKSVLFVATAQAGDEEMRRRIEDHRRTRPTGWRTLEVPAQVGMSIIREIGDSQLVLVDCITLMVSNAMVEFLSADGSDVDEGACEKGVCAEIEGLVKCLKEVKADFIIVTNEVGLGLVPDNKLGRVYRDLLGKANQVLAVASDEVYFMVAGLPVRIK